VLSGGGGFGAFEVGVLKALVSGRSPATLGVAFQPEIFTGTSVGAYNAAVLAFRPDLNIEAAVTHLEDLWLHRIAGDLADNGVLHIRGNPLWLFDVNKLISDSRLHLTSAARDAVYLSNCTVKLLANFLSSPLPLFDRTLDMSAWHQSSQQSP
jgi:predicted acylesterase/phospholipase RssA